MGAASRMGGGGGRREDSGQAAACSSAALCTTGTAGAPFPFGVRRDVLALHDDGERAQARVVADMGVVEDGRVRADEDAAPER